MGTSGLVSPFTNLKGLYFDDSNETDNFSYLLDQDLKEIYNKNEKVYITVDADTSDKFFDNIVEMEKFNKTIIATGTAVEGEMNVVVDEIKDMDEASTISHPKKKKADKEREEREAEEKARLYEIEEERMIAAAKAAQEAKAAREAEETKKDLETEE